MEIVKGQNPVERLQSDQNIFKTAQQKNFFRDNFEHLEALELEAKIRLALAYIREKSTHPPYIGPKQSSSTETGKLIALEKNDFQFPDLLPGKVTLTEMEILLEGVSREHMRRVENSIHQGIELPFESFCSSYGLDHFQRTVILLLLANNLGKGVRNFLDRHSMKNWKVEERGIKIETLLDILTPGFQEKIVNRKYFSIGEPLIEEEIIIFNGKYDQDTNIFDMIICLNEWVVRFILGDKNIYDTSMKGIFRNRNPIAWERVILAQDIKDEILQLTQNYTNEKKSWGRSNSNQFYGYGRGLTFLFSGPSGTGKTMLAHALAHKLNKDLLSLETEVIKKLEIPFEAALKYIFREAKLSDAIVFFDECNDIFHEGTLRNRALLIEIEKADCITIFATNKAEELDSSLDRRIMMRVPFYIPDELQREEIWKASVPPDVLLSVDVDLKVLARKFIFTGGLIKNTVCMAIQNRIGENGRTKNFLSQKDIEKAAGWQITRMLKAKGIETIYQPQVQLGEVAIRTQDKKWFQRLVSVYERFAEKDSGLSIIVGSSDIQIGIECVEGVARACNLKVKKFSFSNVVVSKQTIPRQWRLGIVIEEINPLESAFMYCPGQRNLILFVDHDGDFQDLLVKNRENPAEELLELLKKLRYFNGLFFMVTKPIRKQDLPVEVHHYIELKYPSKELQLRRWEDYLSNSGYRLEDLMDLIERHPMHLTEIDSIVRRANINASLQSDEGLLTIRHIYEVIERLKKKKEIPPLFGSNTPFHGIVDEFIP